MLFALDLHDLLVVVFHFPLQRLELCLDFIDERAIVDVLRL